MPMTVDDTSSTTLRQRQHEGISLLLSAGELPFLVSVLGKSSSFFLFLRRCLFIVRFLHWPPLLVSFEFLFHRPPPSDYFLPSFSISTPTSPPSMWPKEAYLAPVPPPSFPEHDYLYFPPLLLVSAPPPAVCVRCFSLRHILRYK